LDQNPDYWTKKIREGVVAPSGELRQSAWRGEIGTINFSLLNPARKSGGLYAVATCLC